MRMVLTTKLIKTINEEKPQGICDGGRTLPTGPNIRLGCSYN